MQIEGKAAEGIAALESALQLVKADGVDAELSVIDTLIG